ncbi:helix-turn-helix transcriptional regulator [Halorientalis halophila]|uniref:helix-turn-helix transcriptional regulator n=1 Tax=Halorientalis halophila TaxID=3108499 RepID=UPI0030099141
MSRPLSLAFVCVLLVGTVLGQGVAAGSVAAGDPADDPASVAQADRDRAFATLQEFDRTRFVFTVYENGSARWTERHFQGLANDTERESFREYADRFRTTETDAWTDFQVRASELTAAGADATGRNMTARNFNRTAGLNSVGNGVVEMSFLWSNFAETSGDEVVVGDIFEGGGPYINEDQELSVVAGPSLSVVESDSTDPDQTATLDGRDSLIWFGPESFPSGLTAAFATGGDPADGQAGGDGTGTTETDGGPQQASTEGIGLLPLVLFGIVIVAIGAGAGIAWRTGMFGSTSQRDDDPGAGGESGVAAGAGTVGDAESDSGEGAAVAEEELLSDEDRVISLLEENGGRMKQATIVDETGWSKSKVSMLLSDMAEAEDISKLRVGRENIISLKGHEPDAAGSPFDDE